MKKKTIYALGFFDGVHAGHQVLLSACRMLSDHVGCTAGAVTFVSHPDTLVTGKTPALINTVALRRQLLRQYGMTQIQVLPFDEHLMHMPWQDFLEDLLSRDAAGFICGADFRFGAGGRGNAELLERFCRERDLYWSVIPDQTLDGIRISSTHIRKLLEDGQMEQAVRFLGHPHMLAGTVMPGRQLGRTLGIPTANIEIPEGVVCPRHGVYACKATVDGQTYPAVTNIGRRPTVGGHHVRAEAYLLDFSGDLYGKELMLAFYRFIRPERIFDSLDDLKKQVLQDVTQTRSYLS